jgi:hypothetical protein
VLGEVPRPPEGAGGFEAGVADEVAEAYEKPELLGVFELLDASKPFAAPELFVATELLVARELLGRALAEMPDATAARLRTCSGIMVSFMQ